MAGPSISTRHSRLISFSLGVCCNYQNPIVPLALLEGLMVVHSQAFDVGTIPFP